MNSGTVELSEVADIVAGQHIQANLYSNAPVGVPYLTGPADFGERQPTVSKWTQVPKVFAKASDVLLTVKGAGVGKSNLGCEAAIGRQLMAIRPRGQKLDQSYLFNFLRSKEQTISALGEGATVPGITKDDVETLEIPLPPIEEQRRIAAILDQADDLRRKRREALVQTDRLRETLFIAKFKQGDYPSLPLSDVCDLITDGTHYTPTYAEAGTIFLSAKNVTSKRIDWDDVKYIPEALHQELQKRVSPRLHDILLAKNGTTGVGALVDREVVFDIYVSLALLRSGPKIIPNYLLAAINSPATKKQFRGALKGIGVPNLHLVDIRSATIPVPPIGTQKAFAQSSSDIDGIERQYRAHLAKLDALFASLQHRAFRSEP